MNVQTPEQSEVAQARDAVRDWLGLTHFESDEALASSAMARIREEYGLTLHAEWNSDGLQFKTHWTTVHDQRVTSLPCAFSAEHFDHARLLACAGVLEAAPWLPHSEFKVRPIREGLGLRTRSVGTSRSASLS